jgi:1-deoxy-11beta-hydroxypentalenate dehydrogenase
MMETLVGKVAVVTGAGGGIGRSLAIRLVEEGAQVVISDVDEQGLKETAELAGPDRVTAIRTDVSTAEEVGALTEAVWEKFGRLDVLCSNAGVLGPYGDPIWEVEVEEWDRVLSVNLFGTVHLLRAMLPRMLDSAKPGHVLITASMAGLTPGQIVTPYSASKHALVALGEALIRQLAARDANVGVTLLCPGPVKTGMVERENSRGTTARSGDDMAKQAAGEDAVYITPDDVAQLCVQAIQDGTTYVLPNPGSLGRLTSYVDELLAAAN